MDTKDIASIYGVILGDLCGQPYEYKFKGELPTPEKVNIYNTNSKYTDDTILTLITYRSLYDSSYREQCLSQIYKDITLEYQDKGFGKKFLDWARLDDCDIVGNSWGNGSIMRIAPFIVAKDLKGMCESINTSHCSTVSLRAGLDLYELYHTSKPKISDKSKITPFTSFTSKADETIQKVREIFYATSSTHEAIKLAVSLGGDTDTIASIVGGLSAYHYDDITLKDIQYIKFKLRNSSCLSSTLDYL